jgi:hypothetical protein
MTRDKREQQSCITGALQVGGVAFDFHFQRPLVVLALRAQNIVRVRFGVVGDFKHQPQTFVEAVKVLQFT